LALTPAAIDTLMPSTSLMSAAGSLSSRAQAAAAPIVPMVPVACQAPPPLWLGLARLSRDATSKPTMNAASVSAGIAPVLSASGSRAGMIGATSWPCI
jgi:hypothetical protein